VARLIHCNGDRMHAVAQDASEQITYRIATFL
jgi:hypothetical protein